MGVGTNFAVRQAPGKKQEVVRNAWLGLRGGPRPATGEAPGLLDRGKRYRWNPVEADETRLTPRVAESWKNTKNSIEASDPSYKHMPPSTAFTSWDFTPRLRATQGVLEPQSSAGKSDPLFSNSIDRSINARSLKCGRPTQLRKPLMAPYKPSRRPDGHSNDVQINRRTPQDPRVPYGDRPPTFSRASESTRPPSTYSRSLTVSIPSTSRPSTRPSTTGGKGDSVLNYSLANLHSGGPAVGVLGTSRPSTSRAYA